MKNTQYTLTIETSFFYFFLFDSGMFIRWEIIVMKNLSLQNLLQFGKDQP